MNQNKKGDGVVVILDALIATGDIVAVFTVGEDELSYREHFFTPSPCLKSRLYFFLGYFIDKSKPPMIICYAIGKVLDRNFHAAAIAT